MQAKSLSRFSLLHLKSVLIVLFTLSPHFRDDYITLLFSTPTNFGCRFIAKVKTRGFRGEFWVKVDKMTHKEMAEKLGIPTASIPFALSSKPGVSEKKKMILDFIRENTTVFLFAIIFF